MQKTDVPEVTYLPPLPQTSQHEYDADEESTNMSDLGGAEGKPPIILKQTEFSFKHFAKRMGQANNSAFNMWTKVWVMAFLEKKNGSIIWGQNGVKLLQDGLLSWEPAVADRLVTFEDWPHSDNIDNAERIQQQWVEII